LSDGIISDCVTLLSRTRPAPQSKWRAGAVRIFESVERPKFAKWGDQRSEAGDRRGGEKVRGNAGAGSAGPVAAGPHGGSER